MYLLWDLRTAKPRSKDLGSRGTLKTDRDIKKGKGRKSLEKILDRYGLGVTLGVTGGFSYLKLFGIPNIVCIPHCRG